MSVCVLGECSEHLRTTVLPTARGYITDRIPRIRGAFLQRSGSNKIKVLIDHSPRSYPDNNSVWLLIYQCSYTCYFW
jgi:hypothetical protein